MRKPDFCRSKTKGADQLCSDCTTDQRLCFCYMDSTIPLLPKSEISNFCSCPGGFVSDWVGYPEDRFFPHCGSPNEPSVLYPNGHCCIVFPGFLGQKL